MSENSSQHPGAGALPLPPVGWPIDTIGHNEKRARETPGDRTLTGAVELLPDTNQMTVLEAARALAQAGIRVFPCAPRDTPYVKAKAPLVNNWPERASTEVAFVDMEWRRSPVPAIGLPTGDAQMLGNGGELVVLDLDVKNGSDGLASLQKVELELGLLPETFAVSTPSGGQHLYFSVPNGMALKNSASKMGAGIDVRANRGYVLAPGSVLDGKGRYEIIRHLPIAALPEAWIERLHSQPKKGRHEAMPDSSGAAIQVYGAGDGSPYGLAALRDEVENLRQAPPGTRNDQLNRSAFSLAQLVASGHLKKDVVLFALINACIGNGLVKDDGFDAVQSTIESGLRAGLVTPRDNDP